MTSKKMKNNPEKEMLEVNGARIERSFLEENISEAKSLRWVKAEFTGEHKHCIVCGIAITDGEHWKAGNRWMCDYCKERFAI